MRVEIVARVDVPRGRAGAAENRAAQAFLQAVNGEESFFRASFCDAPQERSGGAPGQAVFAGSFLLVFADAPLNQQRGQYFGLLETLRDLLAKEGSNDFLEARLGLVQAEAAPDGHSLLGELIARGESAAQAELRWGLGLAHIQQAILFSARLLRRKLSSQGAA